MSLLDKWNNEARVIVKPLESKSMKEKPSCFLIVAEDYKQLSVIGKDLLEKWQLENFKNTSESCRCFKNKDSQVLVVLLNFNKQGPYGQLSDSPRSYVRNQVGQALHGSCSKAYLVVDETSSYASDIVTGVVEAITLGAYSFKNNKTTSFNIYMKKSLLETAQEAWREAEAVNFARFLVDLPANELNPASYVQLLQNLVKGQKDIKITVKSKELEKEGYGLIHAVGKGAEHAPALVKVSYTSASASKAKGKSKNSKIAFVGKGVTFDTGGLDLKPSNFMRLMKKDMGGSAAVAGLLYYHLNYKPQHDVDYYFAIAENAVDAASFRPGDVYRGGNGLSVEIHNTDAEGRLVLADALSWLCTDKNQPEIVVDIATLTGAIKAGLGSYVGGLFSSERDLSDQIFTSAQRTGDHLWPMPLPYWTESEIRKSEVADLVNATDGYGGAITAAQFLKQFVPEKAKWAHLDIYSWIDSARGPFKQKGGSGQAVLALLDWLKTKQD